MKALLGVDAFVNWSDLAQLLFRFSVDLAFATIVVRGVYLRLYRNRQMVFTCYLFNIVTVSLCLLLRKVPTELGFALALFSVFGILRYRTEQVPSRDLTYLFIVIGIGIVNGVGGRKISEGEILVVNGIIVLATMRLELGSARRDELSVPLFYDRLELLGPGNEGKLNEDIARRTGLSVVRVETRRVDLLRDAAEVTVYFEHRIPSPEGFPPER